MAEFGNDADDDAEDAFFLSAHARTPLAPQRGREGEEEGGLDERREETERLRSMRTLGRKEGYTHLDLLFLRQPLHGESGGIRARMEALSDIFRREQTQGILEV